MSVEIAFRPDLTWVDHGLATDAPALFHHTTLVVPVRLRVNGTDMLVGRGPEHAWSVSPDGVATALGDVTNDWADQPLLGFMLGLEDAVEAAVASGAGRYQPAFGQSPINFTLRPQGVLEISPPGESGSPVSLLEFRTALARLREAAHSWLEQAVPDLRDNPDWPRWFPHREDAI